jgi:hypothetical protein
MMELERLIEALQRHWLVRKYMKPADSQMSEPATEKALKSLRTSKGTK